MTKALMGGFVFAFLFAAAAIPQAHAQMGRSMPRPGMGAATTTRSSNVDLACVGTAVTARESSISAAAQTYSTAFTAAFSARTTALTAAYAMSEPASARAAVKGAWSTYRASMRTARTAWDRARADAWRTFRTAAAACKAPRGTDDAENMKVEAGAI